MCPYKLKTRIIILPLLIIQACKSPPVERLDSGISKILSPFTKSKLNSSQTLTYTRKTNENSQLLIQFSDFGISQSLPTLPIVKIIADNGIEYFDSGKLEWVFDEPWFFVPLLKFQNFEITISSNDQSFSKETFVKVQVFDDGRPRIGSEVPIPVEFGQNLIEKEFFLDVKRDLDTTGTNHFLELSVCEGSVQSLVVLSSDLEEEKEVKKLENISSEKTIIPLEINSKTAKFKFKILATKATAKLRVKSVKKMEYETALKYETEQPPVTYSTKRVPSMSYTIPGFQKNVQSRYAIIQAFNSAEEAIFKRNCGFQRSYLNFYRDLANRSTLQKSDFTEYSRLKDFAATNVDRDKGGHQFDMISPGEPKFTADFHKLGKRSFAFLKQILVGKTNIITFPVYSSSSVVVSGVIGRSGYGYEENKMQYLGILGGLIVGIFLYILCCFWGPIAGESSPGKQKRGFEIVGDTSASNVRGL